MTPTGRHFVLLALIILGSIALHSYRFQRVEYRQDEINTVHAATVLDAAGIVDWLGYEGTHPPGWRIFAAEWVKAFGHERTIARFQSTLFTVLALAFSFRLGKDLFNTQIGLLTVLFIGILPYAQWHFHELRPYAPLIMISAAMQVIFLRWLCHANWRLALAYVVLGGVGLQVHYFVGFVMVAHGLYMLVALEWQLRRIWHFGFLVILILLSFAWWLPAIYHGAFVIRDNGINYGSGSTQESLTIFITELNYAPFVLLPLIFLPTQRLLGSLPVPANLNPRWLDWRRTFILSIPLGVFLSAAVANNFVQLLTFRNLSVTLPMLGVAFGFSLQILPRYVKWGVVLVYVLVTSLSFVYYAPQLPHQAMADFMNGDLGQNDKFVLNVTIKGASAPSAIHYFRDHLNDQPEIDRFYMVNELNQDRVGFKYNIDPFVYEVAQDTFTPEDLATFEQFLADTDHVYFIIFHRYDAERDVYTLRPQYEEILLRDFVAVREMTWPVDGYDPRAVFTIIEYRRH